jgi:hypothetical protein
MGSTGAAGHDAMMRHLPVTPVLLLIDSDANLDIPLSEHLDLRLLYQDH